jgi:type II secretion system-associated lipoprotein
MRRTVIFLASLAVMISACDTLVFEGDMSKLKAYESKRYILKKTIEVDEKKLEKGDLIRIVITTGGEWVKVHGYSAKADELKVERNLLLYLFKEDFKDRVFSFSFFDKKLREIVTEVGGGKSRKKKESDW